MLRYVRLTIEFLAGFAGVLLVVGFILVWRLNAHPFTSTVLTPYIEAAIGHMVPDTSVRIAHTVLSWDNVDYAFNVHADGIEIKDKNDAVIAAVPDLDARVNMFGMLIGRIMPRTLVVNHPQIRMEHAADGKLYFGGLATTQAQGNSKMGRLLPLSRELAHAHFLRRLQVTDAEVDVYTEDGAKQWSVHVPEVSLERINGVLSGRVDINLSQGSKVSTLELHYIYNDKDSLHELATNFENINPSLLAGGHPELVGLDQAAMFNLPLTGDITAAFDDDLMLQDGAMKVHGGKGELVAPNLWDQPRAVKSLGAEGSYDGDKHRLDVKSVALDFGGPKLNIHGSGSKPLLSQHDLAFEFTVDLADWPMDQYTQLWPKPLIPNAREWIAANLSKGAFDHGEATFKGELDWSHLDDVNITDGQGTISASHAVVKYMDGMPPVEDVSCDASFNLKQMDVRITGGSLWALRLEPFTIKMTELDTDMQYIDIPLQIAGPIPDVLKLIDQPPLQYAKAAGLSPTDIAGNAEGLVKLHFPLLKTLAMKDVDIGADVKLTNVASSKLVKGIDVTQGALDLELDKTSFSVKGPAAFNSVPLQLTLMQNFNAEPGKPLREATLSGAIKDEQWKTLGVNAFDGSHGDVLVSVRLTQAADKKSALTGQFDMTPGEIHIDQLNWKKPAGTPATLKFAADLEDGKDTVIKSIELTGPQVNVKGNGRLDADGGLKALNIDPMVIGRTNAALFVSQNDNTLRFEAHGASLDVSGLRGGKDPSHTKPEPVEYRIKTGKLYTSEDGFIAGAEGFAIRDTQGWSAISLHGLADGEHKLTVDLTPQPNGTRVFSVFCDDFGKALKGLGFTDTVKNGDLKITGSSAVDNPRAIEGVAKIGHFDVQGLPVLMLLLSATTPFSIIDVLTNQVSFDKLKGKFRWEGDSVQLINVNAAGSSIGMNIDGKVDMNSGDAKLHGTIVPFSMFNRIISAIPLLGDIFTGGEGGGVLAVAYNIDGALADPKISVNPVSLLTPGFLRNIFFNNDDDTSDEAAQVNPPATGAVPETESNIGK